MRIFCMGLIINSLTMAPIAAHADSLFHVTSYSPSISFDVSKEDALAMSKAAHTCAMDYLEAFKIESGEASLRSGDIRHDSQPGMDDAVLVTSSNSSPALRDAFGKDKLLIPLPSENAQGEIRKPDLAALKSPIDLASYSYMVQDADGLRFLKNPAGNNSKLNAKNHGDDTSSAYSNEYWSSNDPSNSLLDSMFFNCGKSPRFVSMLRSGALRSCRNLQTLSLEVHTRSRRQGAPYQRIDDISTDLGLFEHIVSPTLDRCLSEADRALATEGTSSRQAPGH